MAIGRGYHWQYATDQDANLEKVRAETIDPDPLSPQFPTLFHRLATTVGDVSHHIGTDQEGYQNWYLTIKQLFMEKATKAATVEVDEKWLLWKADQIDRHGATYETEIAAKMRKRTMGISKTSNVLNSLKILISLEKYGLETA